MYIVQLTLCSSLGAPEPREPQTMNCNFAASGWNVALCGKGGKLVQNGIYQKLHQRRENQKRECHRDPLNL